MITFQVTVDMDADFGPLTNEALHDNNALGTLEESAKAVVQITSNTVTVADAYTTAEDTVLIVAAPGVLANDSDANGAALTAELVTDVTNGTLVLASDGSFNYTPDLDFFGEDSFTYKAFNGTYRSPAATVTITVTPVNDAPMAVDDAYSVVENTLLTVAAPGVLANDVEVDPDNMVVTLVSNVAHGSLVLLGDGSFTYQPAPDFFGTDTFVYRLITYPAIQSMWTDEATVTITVTEEIPVVFNLYLPMIIK
jgi:VCBS repeat-containing protein